MSTKFLVPLLQKLARCRNVADVSGVAMDGAKSSFACRVGATILLDESLAPVERTCFGCRQDDVEEYLEHWRAVDRVFPEVIARATPVHNWQTYTKAEWHEDVGYNGYGRRLEILSLHGVADLRFARQPARSHQLLPPLPRSPLRRDDARNGERLLWFPLGDDGARRRRGGGRRRPRCRRARTARAASGPPRGGRAQQRRDSHWSSGSPAKP